MNILETFGIQPVLLAAQVVNFLVLLFLLNKFLYKPVLKVLETRRQKIAQSLKEAEEIQQNLLRSEAERQKKLDQAIQEALGIVSDAKKSSAQIVEAAHQKASTDIQEMITKAQKEMTAEREQLYQEMRSDLADLVVIGLKKVADKVITDKERKEIVDKTIKSL